MALAIKNLLGAIITAKTEDKKATCLRWHDKRVVNMLSTFHNNETVDKERRSKNADGGVEVVKKPKMVEEYNKYMGGVDRNDQMVPYYSYSHKLVTLLQLHVKKLISGQKMVEIIFSSPPCFSRQCMDII